MKHSSPKKEPNKSDFSPYLL